MNNKIFFIWYICAECNKPIGTVDVCEVLGYNPGFDGHGFKSHQDAEEFRKMLPDEIKNNTEVKGVTFF